MQTSFTKRTWQKNLLNESYFSSYEQPKANNDFNSVADIVSVPFKDLGDWKISNELVKEPWFS